LFRDLYRTHLRYSASGQDFVLGKSRFAR